MRSLRLRAVPVLHEDDDVVADNDAFIDEKKESLPFFDSSASQNDSVMDGTSMVAQNLLDTVRGEAPSLSIVLLNIVAIIWGTQHAVTKMVVDDSQAAPFTLLRFGLAALLASPYMPGIPFTRDGHSSDTTEGLRLKNVWRWGAEMGFWMFLGFSFQAIGLGSTTAQRSGFLLYLNVKLVPFFARILLGRSISIATWLSAFVAFCGTALLALDGQSIALNEGDIWSVAAAASSAMFILRLEKASSQVPQSAQLNAACLWVVTFLSAIWTFGQGGLSVDGVSGTLRYMGEIVTSHPIELIYLGGVTTALANYIQTKAQKDISAERASVIYSLDPVYGAFFSWLLLGETLGGSQSFIGAGLITLAAATNAFLDFGDKKEQKRQGS
jgi:drug/metabolite transporter (DMT)-like permease